jgi:hypothetical protein
MVRGGRVPREPCQKGTSLLPVVAALKARPDREKLLPERLWKYFDAHLVVSGWYPEQDYFELVEALVKTMDGEDSGGDPWRYLAKFSVRRDLAGMGAEAGATPEAKGVYRNFASSVAGNPERLFVRAVKLWRQYHDTGHMRISGGCVKTNSVIMRLLGLHIPLEGFVRLQGYYLEEFGRLVGVELVSKVTRSTARGDAHCEWEFTLARTPASEAYVASLPPV